MNESLGIVEVHGFCPSLVVLDQMDKRAGIHLLQIELNDLYGTCIKIAGETANVELALEVAKTTAESMGSSCVVNAINSPDQEAWQVIEARPEISPLLESGLVLLPDSEAVRTTCQPFVPGMETPVNDAQSFAIGLIETQGFTAVIEAIDTACKTSDVEVIGREKLGGGYITVIIKGDVAAVEAAVGAGKAKVEGLGKLIAAHVIARPSGGILSLLPK